MCEIELGKGFVAGGEAELEEIINIYGKKLLRYATSILCNYQDAEDIVQSVFISAYQNRSSFGGKHLSAWLYKITYNHCINHLKKRKLLFFSEIIGLREKTIDSFNEDIISDNVLNALKQLKAKDRALVYGRIINEQSYEELSEIFGSSPATLRKQYERAKKKLFEYLSADGHKYCEKMRKELI